MHHYYNTITKRYHNNSATSDDTITCLLEMQEMVLQDLNSDQTGKQQRRTCRNLWIDELWESNINTLEKARSTLRKHSSTQISILSITDITSQQISHLTRRLTTKRRSLAANREGREARIRTRREGGTRRYSTSSEEGQGAAELALAADGVWDMGWSDGVGARFWLGVYRGLAGMANGLLGHQSTMARKCRRTNFKDTRILKVYFKNIHRLKNKKLYPFYKKYTSQWRPGDFLKKNRLPPTTMAATAHLLQPFGLFFLQIIINFLPFSKTEKVYL
jgi:hypothetical protein